MAAKAKIKCCKDCVPPKRYPGCGANCKEYKEEKAALEAENEMIREIKRKEGLIKTGKYATERKWET